MLTNFYIDGFNLYYRAVRNTPYKWLDLRKLAENLVPADTINKICYFTARVDARPDDPSQPQRQQIYLRALETLPGLEMHFGVFRSRTKFRPMVEPVPGMPLHVLVRDTEEKGSDVNLATRLLVDGFNQDYEHAVIVSNDADFSSAMKYVKQDLGLRVTLVNPDLRNVSPKALSDAATYVKRLRRSHLEASQFPDVLTDQFGSITKPPGW